MKKIISCLSTFILPVQCRSLNILLEGSEDYLDKGFLAPVMEDIEKIALKHGDYAVIDYTMGASSRVFDGNYTINNKLREIMGKDFRSK